MGLRRMAGLILGLCCGGAVALPPQLSDAAPFVTTPPAAIARMLTLAGVDPEDVVYDLGAGDGRIVIAAARDFGARGVGIEYDEALVRIARLNAERAGVSHRVRFLQGDLFAADLRDATVVTMFLRETLNRRLRPQLWQQLSPGTPVVSYRFGMGGDWRPEHQEVFEGESIYLWRVPSAAAAP